MIYGTYLLILLVGVSFALWPEESIDVLLVSSYRIQIYWINWRMKREARKLYLELVKLSREAGWPEPPPFVFVNIWERDS